MVDDKHYNVLLENRFRVAAALDKGGMGSVYKGRDEHRNIDVAIKFLLDESTTDDVLLKRFRQEALLLNELNHENVVHVFGFGIHPELGPYLILEYVDGKTIERIIETSGKPFEIEEALSLLIQICTGLLHAHQSGVLHRDLKPSNISIVEDNGRKVIKILDFGIARRLEPEKAQALTRQGQIFGSPLYMSPEQCQGEQVDQRSDIYSIGCVAYEMLTGRPPLVGESWLSTVVKHVTQMPEPPHTVRSGIPPRINAVVMRCLAKDKESRFPTVDSLLNELLNIYEEVAGSPFNP